MCFCFLMKSSWLCVARLGHDCCFVIFSSRTGLGVGLDGQVCFTFSTQHNTMHCNERVLGLCCCQELCTTDVNVNQSDGFDVYFDQ